MDDNKQMFQGNWTCGSCGGGINELPFEPDPNRSNNLKCRDCFKKGNTGQGGNRQMHQGNWSCASCDKDITELPFEPRDTSNLKCRDCFRKS